MRPVSQLKAFIAHAAVGIFALAAPAGAATVFVNLDTTITTDVTGDQSATTPDDQNGAAGGHGIAWDGDGVDVIINTGLTITGGFGSPGGLDASNTGGNTGGEGGAGILMGDNQGSLTASGVFIYGGAGGDGSDGGTGGASDTPGGNGYFGGNGIYLTNIANQITLINTTVQGGQGGDGGAAGDAAGDAWNTEQGGQPGQGGDGIVLDSSNAVVTLHNVTVKGGNGGAGGTSLADAFNMFGGSAGIGFSHYGANATITLGQGALVQGGLGGDTGSGGFNDLPGMDGVGFRYDGVGGTLTNHGTILGGGDADALWITGSPIAITNFGEIGAAAGHDGFAVNIPTGADVGTFVNAGTISGSASTVLLQGVAGSFSNTGVIEAVNGNALWIESDGVPNVIDNTGGTIASVNDSAVGIYWDLGIDGVVFEGGQISSPTNAIFVDSAQAGAIGVKNAVVQGDIAFTANGEILNVTASTLDGDVVFSGGSNVLNFVGSGLSGQGFGSTVGSSGTIAMNVTDGAAVSWRGGAVTTLQIDAGSILGINQGGGLDVIDVVNVGELAFADNGVIYVNTLSGTGHYRLLLFSGSTNIWATGAGSSLDFTGATFEIDASLADESAFVGGSNIVLANDLNGNAIAGVTNGTSLLDNSALLNFHLYRGDASEVGLTANLLVAQVAIALLADIAGEGDDPNSIALGAALDEIGLDGDADIDDLMLALALLPTNADINKMLDALLPETDGIAYDIATDLGDQALDVASKRLDTLLADRLDGSYQLASLAPVALRGSVSDPSARGRVWVQGFGRAVDQSRHSYNTGYDAGSYGVALGADTNLDKATALGAAFSYTLTDADGNGVNHTDTEVESYQLTLYGDHLFDNAVYAKGLLAYGWHQNDIARHDVGGIPGNTATGSYDADHITARAELGRAYKGGTNLTLIPRAHLNAAWYSPDGYSEQGVGGLGLNVAPDDLTSVRLGLGVLARWDIALADGELFQPELRLDYRRDLTRERFETTSEFLGAPGIAFRTQGVESAADILNLGVGALLATAGGVDLRASYDLELKEDYTAHAGYVRASIPF